MEELVKQRLLTVFAMFTPSYARDEAKLAQTRVAFRMVLDVVAHADCCSPLH